MVSDNELYLDMMRDTLKRWNARTDERVRIRRELKRGRVDAVESPERMAMRVNRLVRKIKPHLAATEAAIPKEVAAIVEAGETTPDDATNDLFERVIGQTRDFLAPLFFYGFDAARRPVARIVTRLPGGGTSYGTGFMVSPRLFLTNFHVFPKPELAEVSVAEFDYEFLSLEQLRPVRRFKLRPDRFFLNNKPLDFALVAIEDSTDDGHGLSPYGWCKLIAEEGKITIGEPVNVIQHPGGGYKQITIRNNQLIDLPGDFAHYLADTDPGSSGSPVFNDQWEVFALHHMGVPKTDDKGQILTVDGSVWSKGMDPKRIEWIANAGTRVSKLLGAIRASEFAKHAMVVELLNVKPAVGNLAAPSEALVPLPNEDEKQEKPPKENPMPSPKTPGRVRIVIPSPNGPIEITIDGDSAPRQDRAQRSNDEGSGFQENTTPDAFDVEREGFDPQFLGVEAPLPRIKSAFLPKAVVIDSTADNPYELKYHHYSVMLRGDRKLAFVSAVNFDMRARHKFKREGGDKWYFDSRVEKRYQAGNDLYSGNALDRGHLTRRADAAWGETEEEAESANNDTFHWTNCSPQHEVFNQPTKANQRGLKLWGTLEEYVAKQVHQTNGKVSVYNGPICRADDEPYRNIQLPKEFFKVIAYRGDAGTLRAVAFKLSQEALIRDLAPEDFVEGEYRPFQVAISELEAATGLDFGVVERADSLSQADSHESFTQGMEAIAIESLSDVRL